MTTEPRRPGWYWVKVAMDRPWVAAKTSPGGSLWVGDDLYPTESLAVIGPRIPTPDEAEAVKAALRASIPKQEPDWSR